MKKKTKKKTKKLKLNIKKKLVRGAGWGKICSLCDERFIRTTRCEKLCPRCWEIKRNPAKLKLKERLKAYYENKKNKAKAYVSYSASHGVSYHSP